MSYDSTIDASKHVENIKWVWENLIKPAMEERFEHHDASKFEDPERACYDKWIPELQKVEYGTPEYHEIKKHMESEGLKHHYESNRHHPEHFPNGISGMNLIDFVEHVCDCYAASMRSDTPFIKGMESNMERFGYPEELRAIVRNTAADIFKNQKPEQF